MFTAVMDSLNLDQHIACWILEFNVINNINNDKKKKKMKALHRMDLVYNLAKVTSVSKGGKLGLWCAARGQTDDVQHSHVCVLKAERDVCSAISRKAENYSYQNG